MWWEQSSSILERLARCVQRVLHDILHIQAINVGQIVSQVPSIWVCVQHDLRGTLNGDLVKEYESDRACCSDKQCLSPCLDS